MRQEPTFKTALVPDHYREASMTISEAAKYLKVSGAQVQHMMALGELDFYAAQTEQRVNIVSVHSKLLVWERTRKREKKKVRTDWTKTKANSLALDGAPDRPGVYFIGSDTNDLIKIGVATKSIRGRTADIQGGSPVRLKFLAWCPGDRNTESEEHERWAASRAHGEWFHTTDELLLYIARLDRDALH